MSYQLLKLSDVSKAYGPKEILQHVSLTISHGDRLAIIGENGVGKSTLARLITRIEFPDSGVIETAEALRIGYLPQEVEGSGKECTVGEFLVGRCHSLRIRMEALEAGLANKEVSEEVQRRLLGEWERCHEELQAAGGYDSGHRCKIVLGGLGLSGMDCSMPMAKISGGERSKVAFARLLLESPDLLVLDEPTNHLDIKAVEWLESFLSGYRGAVLMITHDRTFLNRVCNRLAELSPTAHQLTLYTGNYDAFLEEKKRERERKLCEFVQWNEEKKALRQLIRAKSFAEAKPPPPKDGNTMAYDSRGEHFLRSKSRILRQAKGRLEELEAEKLTHPIPKAYRGIYFEPLELCSTVAIEAIGVSKSYEGRTLFTEVSFELQKKARIVLQGDNGCGKTTLMNVILGAVPLDGGRVKTAPSVKIGYLDQNLEMFPSEGTVGETLMGAFTISEGRVQEELHKTGLADAGLLRKTIGTLSLGQKKRLLLLYLMLSKCNVLFLDEPTNHLDLTILESLEAALKTFQGAVFAVSHDRRFIERVATDVWRLENGRLREGGPNK